MTRTSEQSLAALRTFRASLADGPIDEESGLTADDLDYAIGQAVAYERFLQFIREELAECEAQGLPSATVLRHALEMAP